MCTGKTGIGHCRSENRYRTLQKSRPEVAERLLKLAKKDAAEKFALMQELAKLKYNGENETGS
jgi:hypothetical protein